MFSFCAERIWGKKIKEPCRNANANIVCSPWSYNQNLALQNKVDAWFRISGNILFCFHVLFCWPHYLDHGWMCSVPLLYDSVLSGPSPPKNRYMYIQWHLAFYCNGAVPSSKKTICPFLPTTLWNEKPPFNRWTDWNLKIHLKKWKQKGIHLNTLSLHCFEVITLPRFNSSPLKSYLPNRKVVTFHPPFF